MKINKKTFDIFSVLVSIKTRAVEDLCKTSRVFLNCSRRNMHPRGKDGFLPTRIHVDSLLKIPQKNLKKHSLN